MCGPGAGAADGGRGTPASGRREVYSRRHDPQSPSYRGRPSFGEALEHHTVGKYDAHQNAARGIMGAAIPGAGVALGLQALSAAQEDAYGKSKPGKTTSRGEGSNAARATAGKKKAAEKPAPALAPQKDTLGQPVASSSTAPTRRVATRRSTIRTGSRGILTQANVGKTLLGA